MLNKIKIATVILGTVAAYALVAEILKEIENEEK
jgi:hypothetical protein